MLLGPYASPVLAGVLNEAVALSALHYRTPHAPQLYAVLVASVYRNVLRGEGAGVIGHVRQQQNLPSEKTPVRRRAKAST